jgi:predicted ATPase/transcriptional regulator with XRE-family HTH domain/Flp pilus assembly protein TadD
MDYSFGMWVKRRRKALDLTQQELAKQIGCSPSLIFKIESDERRPSRQMAELLAEKLDIPADQRPLFLKTARQEKSPDSLGAIPPLSPLASSPKGEAVSPPKPTHSHLPVSPTPLFGREHELHLIPKQLLEPACRLLTLTGPGGIGKTRLAVEVGRALEPHFADGVYFVSLAGVGAPDSIPPAIADALGFGFSGPADLMVQLTNFLHEKQILLIFDNMEHLLDARDLLGKILLETHHVRMIVTSREPLRLQWEWLFEVQGLPLPEENDVNAIETNSAVQLFIQRARQASQSFSLETEDPSAIIRICRMVGGLPLAIELAASWVRMLSAREIAHELEKSLDFLESNKFDVPQRHRSIKTVFDHSWELLTDEERDLLRKLSVFQGGFTREAAVAATGASLLLLSSLVDKSLLRHSKNPDRYDLHELVRAYALEKLQANPSEEEAALAKYAEHYAAWIQSLEWEFKSPRQTHTSQIIRTETCNWHCTGRWAIEERRLDLLRKMLPTLNWYFEVNGYYDEAIAILKPAVEQFRMSGAPASLKTAEERSAFAFLLDCLGWFEFRKGNVETAVPLLQESLEIAREQDDPEVMYYIHGNWGYLCLFTGEIEEARRLTMESLRYSQKLKPWHQAIPKSVLGIVAYQQENFQESLRQLTEGLSLWRIVGDPRGLVFTMTYMGMTSLGMKDYDAAKSVLIESNQIAEANMDRWAHAFGMDMLGIASILQGQNEEAIRHFQQSISLYDEIGDQMNSAQVAIHMGQAYAAMRQDDEAKRLYLDAYSKARTYKWSPVLLNALVSFVEMPNDLPHETKLGVALSVLDHPAVTPYLRGRSEMMREAARSNLSEERIRAAEELAKEKSPEIWAQELLK